jgi:hypothetical protein
MKTFNSIVVRGLVLAVVVAANLPAYATTYNDGGVHTISGADSDVVISNGTTVNVVPGATVSGTSIDPVASSAITVADVSSFLNVTGGSITGGNASHHGGSGLSASGGHFDISGGSFVGGFGSGMFINETGGNGAAFDFQSQPSLSITGGSFTGGAGFVGGDGLRLSSTTTSGPAFVSGGTFTGGQTNNFAGGGSPGYDLHAIGPVIVNVSGGEFTGNMSFAVLGDSSIINVSGGQFDNRVDLINQGVVNVSGGQFNNGGRLNLHDNSVANVSGGTISRIALMNSSIANVNGGQLTDQFTLVDTSVMNLTGGHILPTFLPPTPTFAMAQSSVLNVFGTDLALQNVGGSFWNLQGTLQDGTPIPANTKVKLLDNAVVNLHQISEPASITLAALILLGLTCWSWRRRAAARAHAHVHD